jgi:hypothetical protein
VFGFLLLNGMQLHLNCFRKTRCESKAKTHSATICKLSVGQGLPNSFYLSVSTSLEQGLLASMHDYEGLFSVTRLHFFHEWVYYLKLTRQMLLLSQSG